MTCMGDRVNELFNTRQISNLLLTYMAVGQNQWYHFGVGAPLILVHCSGDWDVHRGYDLGFDHWPEL